MFVERVDDEASQVVPVEEEAGQAENAEATDEEIRYTIQKPLRNPKDSDIKEVVFRRKLTVEDYLVRVDYVVEEGSEDLEFLRDMTARISNIKVGELIRLSQTDFMAIVNICSLVVYSHYKDMSDNDAISVDDGGATVRFASPVAHGDTIVDSIRIKPAYGFELCKIDSMGGRSVIRDMNSIHVLSGMPLEAVRKMDLGDFWAAVYAINEVQKKL